MSLNRRILSIIRRNPGISTRDIINRLAVRGITKQKICGHLSWLKRSGQISIIIRIPKRYSVAY